MHENLLIFNHSGLNFLCNFFQEISPLKNSFSILLSCMVGYEISIDCQAKVPWIYMNLNFKVLRVDDPKMSYLLPICGSFPMSYFLLKYIWKWHWCESYMRLRIQWNFRSIPHYPTVPSALYKFIEIHWNSGSISHYSCHVEITNRTNS